MTALVWLRNDVRLADNPALHFAAASGRPVAVLYVLDETASGPRPLGAAARWWLHHSLTALGADLKRQGAELILRRGSATVIVPEVARAVQADEIHWNQRHDTTGAATDRRIAAALRERGVKVETHRANLLHDPADIRTGSGGAYRVFTPFWRACQSQPPPRAPYPAPPTLRAADTPSGDALADWSLVPERPDWAADFPRWWVPGEAGARAALDRFIGPTLDLYADQRDFPGVSGTSRLSPHLRFGEISPFQIFHAVTAGSDGSGAGADKYLAEIGWREFCWHLLHHAPDLPTTPLNPRFAHFPWRPDPALLRAWQRGKTGIPIVDAGMRQLWQTGWMHNRVRMIVASFLVKHLLQDWRRGEAWFWDTLVDADEASNPASWQWVAGCGADAAPYFRIFNPVLQGQKFDPDGAYIRQFVPELAAIPARDLQQPPTGPLAPKDYPGPIIDPARGRDRALAAFASLKALPEA